jgi:hypothetical protein
MPGGGLEFCPVQTDQSFFASGKPPAHSQSHSWNPVLGYGIIYIVDGFVLVSLHIHNYSHVSLVFKPQYIAGSRTHLFSAGMKLHIQTPYILTSN